MGKRQSKQESRRHDRQKNILTVLDPGIVAALAAVFDDKGIAESVLAGLFRVAVAGDRAVFRGEIERPELDAVT